MNSMEKAPPLTMAPPRNRYDLHELAGAFGDLGTLIPFVAAYVSLLKMDPGSVLLPFGVALVVAGMYYRTPFPVQPMKAIGAAATLQGSAALALSPAMVVSAGLATGLIWLLLALSGLAKKIAAWVPRPALIGVVMGLGFSFMLEGIRMMRQDIWIAAVLLPLTLLLLSRPRLPAMAVLLGLGAALALIQQPGLAGDLAAIRLHFSLPAFAWPELTGNDLWLGLVLLALPQLPLTFGNALIAITEENNRQFPDRPVNERQVALSTALLNLGSSAMGGVPMCHGAGGMAGHTRFGARTGGASVMLGVLLLFTALFLGDSLATLFRVFPPAVLGIILFMAGIELAMGARDPGSDKVDRFVVLATAALAIWNVGIAVLFGFLAYYASRRGWLRM
jgi:MFS superfamily sulfate permease-like transporter